MKSEKYSTDLIEVIGELSGDGIFIYNLADQKFKYCNEAFSGLLEISREDIIHQSHQSVKTFLKEDDTYMLTHFEELKVTSKLHNVEVRLKSQTGDKFISCDIYLVRDQHLVIGIVKDITTLKEHANYIIEFGARKDVILDMVAHNLSGPLNLTADLLNLIDQLNKSVQYKKIDSHTRLIRENTQQCIEIINSFLKEEHLESEHVFVRKNRFDVIAKIKIVMLRLKAFNTDKRLDLVSNTRELIMSGDDVKFFQVIHNLLSNAVKFTPSGGVISVDVQDKGKSFTIVVKDNGIGIPEYLQSHIFKKNTPASREGLRGEKSIGIGLYIVKELVELMKGKISFESGENRGTSFLVELPKEL